MNAVQRKRIRSVRTFVLVGAAVGFLIGLLLSQIDQRLPLPSGARGAAVGVMIGLAVGFGEEFLLPAWSRRVGFFMLNSVRLLLYVVVMTVALTLVNALGIVIGEGVGLGEGARRYIFEDHPARDFILSLAAVVLLTSLLEVRTLHNRGEIWRFLTGRYRYPQEETRIFLFADLAGSTALAERLGNLHYSSFLRECFRDTSEAILAWGGDTYQFAGDGVIVTWPLEECSADAACLRCYFEMTAALAARAEDYQRRYGTIPHLRGAVHGGEVVTAWVGEAKREIAFHGDTLNAAARIEAVVKETTADCLASEWVLQRVKLPPELNATAIGDVQLRGKQDPVSLFSIERRPAADQAPARLDA